MENNTIINAQFTITPRTKLGEVLEMLDLGEKPAKTPSVKALYEESAPIAEMNGCALFRNVFVVYTNRSGRTVIWLPRCTHFTYYFNKLRDAEKDTLHETFTLPEGYLEKQRWVVAVTLIGEHRIEANAMNRTGSRKDTVDLASKDRGDKDDRVEEVVADPYRRAFNWYDGHIGENPLDAIIRRENREEMLAAMTDKQREVFIMFYRDCHTQEEIADILKIDRSSVRTRLSYAIKKAKKILQ